MAAQSLVLAKKRDVEAITITRVKFHRRNTTIFRSDGQIDFLGSNNVVYSSRNIDFKRLKWDPATTSEIMQQRVKDSPSIVDVVFEDHDLLLMTSSGVVYLFSLDRMTVEMTKIKTEQAALFPFNNRLQLFSDFLIYDHTVIVSHYNVLSICDLNARVCHIKSWRHFT